MKYTNYFILRNLKIPIIENFSDLSSKLVISKRKLYLFTRKKALFYHQVMIPKKNGKNRELQIPSFSMKVTQRWIYEEILKKIIVSEESMAFVPNKNGILDSSKKHYRNLYLLEMDIHNFFGSITSKQIWKVFRNLGYNDEVSTLLTELCTYNNCLPQGAVTSPYLANIVCRNMDSRISGLCRRRGIVYSRYADDLCFSSDNRLALNKIKVIIQKIVADEGFSINEEKTRFLSEARRKDILGITVNQGEIHVNKEYKRLIRSKIYNSIMKKDYSEKNVIRGMISYVSSIEGEKYRTKVRCYIDSIIKKADENGDIEAVNEYKVNMII